MRHILACLLLITLGSTAIAHSKVNATMPENGAVLAEAPAAVTLNFAKKIRLIKVEMTYQDTPKVMFDLGDQKSFATEYTLPPPEQGAGTYLIEWRGLSIDGHAMTGEFAFTVE